MDDRLLTEPDPAFDALRSARPATPPELTDPAAPAAIALLDRILSSGTAADVAADVADDRAAPVVPIGAARSRRWTRYAAVGAAVASVAAVVAVAFNPSVSVDDGKVSVSQAPQQAAAAIDLPRIAAATEDAVGTTGRATLRFEEALDGATFRAGTSEVGFAGDDTAITMQIDGNALAPGFEVRSRTVDGEFYLYDGPIGAKQWYHDVNAAPAAPGDVVRLDPRALLAALSEDAGLELVDDAEAEASGLRHLRATTPADVPTLDLTLGPLDSTDITALDLWVDEDDVVQRLDLATSRTEVPEPGCFIQDGVKECAEPGELFWKKPDGTMTFVPGDPNTPEPEPRTTTATYSVRFSDLGAPVEVVAPENPVIVEGKG